MATNSPGKAESNPSDSNLDYFEKLAHELGLEEEKMTTMDGRTFYEDLEENDVSSQNLISRFFADVATKDPKALHNLHDMYIRAGGSKETSKRDLIVVILTSCDPFLAQDLLQKLISCNVAVPVFFTDAKSSQVRFLLWELKRCFKLRYDKKSKKFLRTNLTSYPFMTISAVRFGEINGSKTAVLNQLLRLLHGHGIHANFTKEEPTEILSTLSKGLIESFWYMPNERSTISFPICLLNLIGDALHYETQMTLCHKNSQICIVFSSFPIKAETRGKILSICKTVHVILILFSSNKDIIEVFQGTNVSVIRMNDVDGNAPLTKVIRQIKNIYDAKLRSFRALEKFQVLFKDQITNVRLMERCSRAKQLADEICRRLGVSGPKTLKKNIFPLQSFVHSQNIEENNEEVKNKDLELTRREQQKVLLSEEMKKFINIALDKDKMLVNFFCSWLHITLREKARQNVKNAINAIQYEIGQRRRVYAKVRTLKVTPKTKSWSQFRRAHSLRKQRNEKAFINKRELDAINAFDERFVGLEHFIRELAEIVESEHVILTTEGKNIACDIIDFNVDILVNGYYLDFFNIEASFLSVRWFNKVMIRLQNKLSASSNVRVISVFGGKNSGKSHLLNCIFGTNFPEGEGRCTTGARMAMVPVHGSILSVIGCDFIIVIDTESVSVAETTSRHSSRRNDLISTLVCTISDIVIVNIGKNDTPEEITGVLNIFLRGLHRVSKICQEMKVCIVRQYKAGCKEPVPNLIQKKIKKIIENSTKKKIHLSSDLLNFFCFQQFETIQNIYFRTLLCPKMSSITKVMTRYSYDLKGIRRTLLQILRDEKYTIRLVTEFGDQTSDVLYCIKCDNFFEELRTASEKRKRSNFLSQCEEQLTSIQTKLALLTEQKCTELENLFNPDDKDIGKIVSLGTQYVSYIAELCETEHKGLKSILIEESRKSYFQKFLSDVSNMIQRIDSSYNTQTTHAKEELVRTVENMKKLNEFLKRWRSKVVVAEKQLKEAHRTFSDQILAVKETDIGGFLQYIIQQSEALAQEQFHELKKGISKDIKTITIDTFLAPHLKILNDSVDSLLDSLLQTMLDDLESRAKEAKEFKAFNDQFEEKASHLQCEVNKELFATCSELLKCGDNIDGMCNHKQNVIHQLVQKILEKIQNDMQDVIAQSKTLTNEILGEKINVLREKVVAKVEKHTTKSAELMRKTKALMKRERLDENFDIDFEIILCDVRVDLEKEISDSCITILHTENESIADIIKSKEDEFKHIASIKFGNIETIIKQWDKSKLYDRQINSLIKRLRGTEQALQEKISTRLKETSNNKQSVTQSYKKVNQEMDQLRKNFMAKICSKEEVDKLFKPWFHDQIRKCKQKYPMRRLVDIHGDTQYKLLDRIRNLGHNVSTLSNCSNTCKETHSIADISDVSARFCVVENKDEITLKVLETNFIRLAQDYLKFDKNTEKVIRLIQSFEEKCNLMVERITLFSFLCAKFVFASHEKHLSAEIDLLKQDKSKRELVLGNEEECDEIAIATKLESLKAMDENYIIQFTEPLAFKSLQEKVEIVCSLLKDQNLGEELDTISMFLVPLTVRNYHYLPFTIKTIQTIDSCFVRLLPPMTSDDMKNIDEAMYEAKLSIIGKMLTKVLPEINQFFYYLRETVNQFPRTKHYSDVKTASLKHLSAWSSTFLSVREYEKEKETNVAHIAEKQEGKCLMKLYNYCDYVYDELVAEELCDEIELQLKYSVEKGFASELLKEFPKAYRKRTIKKLYVKKTLRDLMEGENFTQFIQFVNGMATCDRWILKFLAKECFMDKKKVIENIRDAVITEKINLTRRAIKNATFACEKVSHKTLRDWLQKFQSNFICEGSVNMTEELKILQAHAKVANYETLSRCCLEMLRGIEERLIKKHTEMEKGINATQVWLLSLPSDTATHLGGMVKGCAKRCPQCGHPCINSSSSHETHETSVHIPKGIKGAQNEKKFLVPTTCIDEKTVPQDNNAERLHSEKDVSFEWVFNKVKKEPLVFWKYVFHKFNKQFAKYYDCKEEVPKGWDFTKDAAQKSLKHYFEDEHETAQESVIAI